MCSPLVHEHIKYTKHLSDIVRCSNHYRYKIYNKSSFIGTNIMDVHRSSPYLISFRI